MPAETTGKKATDISDAKVEAATGKAWKHWFHVLDRAGAKDMAHRDIARFLNEEHNVPGWWSQMVTVGYEQERGLRQVHEKHGGFEIGASKTIDAAVTKLYHAWSDARTRKRWLPEAIDVRKATPSKSMRASWADGTHLDVVFLDKGPAKSIVNVQHGKLTSAREAERMKALWKERLVVLKELLE